jgi:hypothetical protein
MLELRAAENKFAATLEERFREVYQSLAADKEEMAEDKRRRAAQRRMQEEENLRLHAKNKLLEERMDSAQLRIDTTIRKLAEEEVFLPSSQKHNKFSSATQNDIMMLISSSNTKKAAAEKITFYNFSSEQQPSSKSDDTFTTSSAGSVENNIFLKNLLNSAKKLDESDTQALTFAEVHQEIARKESELARANELLQLMIKREEREKRKNNQRDLRLF